MADPLGAMWRCLWSSLFPVRNTARFVTTRATWRRTPRWESYTLRRLIPCSIFVIWLMLYLYLAPNVEDGSPKGSLDSNSFMPDASSMDLMSIPHVDECKTCRHCLVTENQNPNRDPKDTACTPGFSRSSDENSQWDLSGRDSILRTNLPDCDVCKGCLHNLTQIDGDKRAFNTTFKARGGFSSAWIYRISNVCQPGGPSLGNRIVKIWCAPFTKENANNQLWAMTLRKWRGKEALPKPTVKRDPAKKKSCDLGKATNAVKMELAVGRIAEACGLQHLLPKVSVASVKGVMPETGHPVDWDGLFMTEAQGISVYSAAYWNVEPSVIEEVLMRRVNSSQVVEAAIFDLLTSQCDRHSNNIFIDDNGSLTLIDNGDALGYQDMCPKGFALNSLFLPSTPEHIYKAVGKKFAQTGASLWVTPSPLPHIVMDYRCHAPNSKIGGNYPPSVKKCLQKISASTEDEVKLRFGLLNDGMASVLKERATNMIERGFEWTLYNGQPQNAMQHRFVPQPTCCSMHQAPPKDLVWGLPWMFYCDDGWMPNIDIHGRSAM